MKQDDLNARNPNEGNDSSEAAKAASEGARDNSIEHTGNDTGGTTDLANTGRSAGTGTSITKNGVTGSDYDGQVRN